MGESRTFAIICMLLLSAPAWGAEGDAKTTSSVPATNLQSFGPPPEFRAMATLQMGNMLACMTTPALKHMGSLFQDGLKSTVAQMDATGGGCGKEISINESELKCSNPNFTDAQGNFSITQVDAVTKTVDEGIDAISCRKKKIEGLKDELGCLSREAGLLSQQVASLQSAYTQNIQRAQQDVGKLMAIEADRKAQFEDVSGKLNGKDIDGGKGLLGLRDEMQKAIAGMPAQIQQIKEDQLAVQRQRKALEEMAESRTMVLANACFNRTRSTYKCVPNGPPVSAREYVICRYKQNLYVGPSGVIKEGTLADKQAASKAKELETVLEALAEDSPADLGKAKSAEEVQQLSNRPVKILSVADIETHYGAKLASFSGNGLDIRDFVTKIMGSCFEEAKKGVVRERKSANSTLSQIQADITKMERATSVRVNELLNGYSQLHSEVMAGMTGQHLPLNVSNCQNAKPDVQAGCLVDIRRNMEGLLSGTTPQSTVDIMIRGNDPNTTISFRCQGLNGCITYMQNAQRNLRQEVKKVEQFKKDYVLKANQSVDQFTNQMAQVMSGQSQQLDNRLKELNATLATMGIRPGIRIDQGRKGRGGRGSRGRGLEMNKETGLYELPEDVLELVGNKMTPPLPDLQGDSFSDALDGVASRVEKLEEREENLVNAKTRLAGLITECQGEIVKDLKLDLQNYGSKCVYSKRDCDNSGHEAKLSGDIASILESIGGYPSSLKRDLGSLPGVLEKGILDACTHMGYVDTNVEAETVKACARKVADLGSEGTLPPCVHEHLSVRDSRDFTGIHSALVAKAKILEKVEKTAASSVECDSIVESMSAKEQMLAEASARRSAAASSAEGGKKR